MTGPTVAVDALVCAQETGITRFTLKFDLVSEGIDCSSRAARKQLARPSSFTRDSVRQIPTRPLRLVANADIADSLQFSGHTCNMFSFSRRFMAGAPARARIEHEIWTRAAWARHSRRDAARADRHRRLFVAGQDRPLRAWLPPICRRAQTMDIAITVKAPDAP
jgi:hypothetical protein